MELLIIVCLQQDKKNLRQHLILLPLSSSTLTVRTLVSLQLGCDLTPPSLWADLHTSASCSPEQPELPGTTRPAETCLQSRVYNHQIQRILDILMWAAGVLIWGELLSASACPRHLITSAWAQTHVSLLKPLHSRTFVRLASTLWQAALWIPASPPGRLGGSAGSPPPANSCCMRRRSGRVMGKISKVMWGERPAENDQNQRMGTDGMWEEDPDLLSCSSRAASDLNFKTTEVNLTGFLHIY